MISHVTGEIIFKELTHVVVDINGVGYKVYTGLASVGELGDRVSLWTHTAVREDALDLYGFIDRETLIFFEQLLRVSGIGPKSALNILSVSSVGTLRSAIAENNTSYLTKISGIGRKTAEKIVLELRDKMGELGESGGLGREEDVLEALVGLGYGRRDIQDILRQYPPKSRDTSERIREILSLMGKK